MGIMDEDKVNGQHKEADSGLELMDATLSSGSSSSSSSTSREEVVPYGDGVWLPKTKKQKDSGYDRGDRIRCTVLFVLMTVFIVTMSTLIAKKKNTPATNDKYQAPRFMVQPRDVNIVNYINSISFTGRILHYPSEHSVEEKALKWVIDEDPAQRRFPEESISIRERYALALFWFQSDNRNFTENFLDSWDGKNYSSTWMTEQYECEWASISCDLVADEIQQQVTTANLFNSNITGQLSPDIALLQTLGVLRLHLNSLTGTIPSSLASLPGIQILDFGDNSFTGTLPTEFGALSTLTYLAFGNNQLEGTIPQEYTDLKNLTALRIYNNSRVTGPIPDFWNNTLLEELHLYNNSLTGTLPQSLFDLPALTLLDVAGNLELAGQVKPKSNLSIPTPLRTLNLQATSLNGSVAELCVDIGSEVERQFSADCWKVECPCCQFCCQDGSAKFEINNNIYGQEPPKVNCSASD